MPCIVVIEEEIFVEKLPRDGDKKLLLT